MNTFPRNWYAIYCISSRHIKENGYVEMLCCLICNIIPDTKVNSLNSCKLGIDAQYKLLTVQMHLFAE